MLAVFLQGFALSAAMILPLGPQNVFVMNQGIRRQYHLMIASLCALSDIVLICAGIFGGSALLTRSPLLLALVTWGGVAFLLWYGWGAFRSAFSPQPAQAAAQELAQSRWRIVVTMLAVTWLNPHVYLDTFVVLGSLGGQLTADVRSGSRSGRSARRRCGSSGWRCWPLAGAVAEHAAGAAHHQRAGRAGDVGHRAAAGTAGGKFIRICH